MTTVYVELDINRPAAEVFAVASDIEHFKERAPAIEHLEIVSDIRSGLGTRWRETRKVFGKSSTATMEIIEWRAPHEYIVGATNGGCEYRTLIRVVATLTGSRLEAKFSAKAHTFFTRVLSAIRRPIMRKAVTRMLMDDLVAIKAYCETN